ncbi:MAG: tetratricopeptide repeat protein, partial [Nocardioidaceae bacterium]
PSGRVDRTAADAVFGQRQAEVEADPASWRAWYRLGVAYDDAGDRTRAREAVRRAIGLFDATAHHS